MAPKTVDIPIVQNYTYIQFIDTYMYKHGLAKCVHICANQQCHSKAPDPKNRRSLRSKYHNIPVHIP